MTTQTPKQQVHEARQRIRAAHDETAAVLDGLRVNIAGLNDAVRAGKLTERYAASERARLRAEAQAKVTNARQAVALANVISDGREALTGADAVLRSARFVAPVPEYNMRNVASEYLPGGVLEDKGREIRESHERWRQTENTQRGILELLTRSTLRQELLDAEPAEIAERISSEGVNNPAFLRVAREVVRRRAAEDPGSVTRAQSALVTALNAVEPPPDVAELNAAFDETANVAKRLSDCLTEIDTGKPPRAPRASIDRVAELTTAHGPVAGAVEFAAEKRAERDTLAKRAQQKAAEHVQRAIAADESDAFKISINHNATPNAA
jgi:hypothetical protein